MSGDVMKRLAVLSASFRCTRDNALEAQKEQPAMEYGAIDLHLRHSLIRIVDETGALVLDRRITTTRDGFERVFAGRPPVRILIESGTESEWVARCLEACGHEVIVADPNYTLMYGHRDRRIKTDRRDVVALVEACRCGVYRRAHRVSFEQRQVRRDLRAREQLIRVRTQAINLLRAQLREEGYRLPSGSAERAVDRLARLSLPTPLREGLEPLVALLTALQPLIEDRDRAVAQRAAGDPVVQRLMTMPAVGPVTALTYRAILDDVRRFRDASAASAFLGLVPREDSSADRRRKGRITKAGPRSPRSLLVQVGWAVWRRGRGPLAEWVHRLAQRRPRAVAVVALARRLARILFAMWRDERSYCVGDTAPAAA
jgi:transposase